MEQLGFYLAFDAVDYHQNGAMTRHGLFLFFKIFGTDMNNYVVYSLLTTDIFRTLKLNLPRFELVFKVFFKGNHQVLDFPICSYYKKSLGSGKRLIKITLKGRVRETVCTRFVAPAMGIFAPSSF